MLISFEGIEGAGKSTQINLLQDYYLKKNKEVLLLREPGSTELGESIREILLSTKNVISDNTELLLMFAARAQLLDQIIKKNIHKVILIDRYFHASIAYQGYGRGLDISKINQLIQITECIQPDYTFLLDISPEDGFRRKSGDKMDRIESAGIEFFNKVRKGYLELAQNNNYMHVISSTQTEQNIHEEIVNIIQRS
jgi:dTMP kinase